MQIFSDAKKIKNNENNVMNCIKDYINNLKNKINLMTEKEKTIEKMAKNNNKIKYMKLENKKSDEIDLNYYNEEYINNVIKDYDKNIKEKQNYLLMKKENLNQLINKIYKNV